MIGLGIGLNRGAASVWNPSRVSGLAVWLDASRITAANSDPIQTWVDPISGFSPTQATSTKRPLLIVNGINGQPALQFDGVDDTMATASVPLLSSCPGATIFIVSQNTNAPLDVTRTMGVLNGAGGFRLGINQRGFPTSYDSAGGRRLDTDTAIVSLVNPGYSSNPRIIRLAANWQGTRLEQYKNGQFYYANSSFQTTGLSDSSYTTLEINSSSNPASIKIAEILIYSRFLSTDETAAAERYLSRKYSISLS